MDITWTPNKYGKLACEIEADDGIWQVAISDWGPVPTVIISTPTQGEHVAMSLKGFVALCKADWYMREIIPLTIPMGVIQAGLAALEMIKSGAVQPLHEPA